MLLELFPTTHLQYTSLPILCPVLEGYVRWLLAEGYSRERVRAHRDTCRLFQAGIPHWALFFLLQFESASYTGNGWGQ